MNKYLLKMCLLASIANVSVANGAEQSATTEAGSPFGHHGTRHGGAPASAYVSNEIADVTKRFPCAVDVLAWDGRASRIPVTHNTTVQEFKSTVEDLFRPTGGHHFTFEGTEIMQKIVDESNHQLIKISDLGWSAEGIPTINIAEDKTRSPKHSNSATPAPQSGKISLDASSTVNPEDAE